MTVSKQKKPNAQRGIDIRILRRTSDELVRRLDGWHDVSLADELTGVGNERYARLRLTEELARSRRFERRASVVLVDLVDLKGVNRRYGHAAGNDALCRVAGVLQENRRRFDVLIRLGGDTFLLFLNDTDLEAAQRLAQRVRLQLRERPVARRHRRFVVAVETACVAVGYGSPFPDVDALLALAGRDSRIFDRAGSVDTGPSDTSGDGE